MAAKRLGSFLSNVTGTAGQVLRVNSGETGFEMFTPATIPAYTVTNKTVDRVINADDVTLDEVADVLGTLIDDLAAMGSTGATQQVWTSQVWSHPPQSGTDYVQYTLQHNFGKTPDKVVAYADIDGDNHYTELQDLFISSGQGYGWYVNGHSSDMNACTVAVERISPTQNVDIYFKCFILGQVAQINPFQWSTSEQVWPFEKDSSGNTLYCKEFNMGLLPNDGVLQASLGTIVADKIWRYEARGIDSNAHHCVSIPFAYPSVYAYYISIQFYNGNIEIETGNATWVNFTGFVRVIYAK